jgi:threonine dehydrogenase-like Zn-dependent dehydrogenase
MRATLEQVPEPAVRRPDDAIVEVVASCICGSDLWPYRGVSPVPQPRRIGHEFVGIVRDVGPDVRTVRPGQFVIAPFAFSDGSCPACRHGVQTSCFHGGFWGTTNAEGVTTGGAQAEYVGVPLADGTLVGLDDQPDPGLVPDLLTLSDVMSTGHHAAVTAGVGPGSSVVVIGDGAVGLSAVLAAQRLGAEQVIAMSRHAPRQELARRFGATGVLPERGDEAVARVRDLFEGLGADVVLECVGTASSMQQAVASARPGGIVGYVGAPYGEAETMPVRPLFNRNVGLVGGVAPARRYIPELLADVLDGSLRPGAVFDLELSLDDVAEGYVAMDTRRAIKTLLRP